MLRVGLTGGLGSGKSTVAAMLREEGAHVIEADEVGRQLMEPGEAVYREIVQHFGIDVVREDGTLDRRMLAELAFQQGRRRELSLIVHPAVIAAQEEWMEEIFTIRPEAIAVVESALIFEADRDGTVPGWRERFDMVVLVTAPHALKVERFVTRMKPKDAEHRAALVNDAEARIAAQIPDEEKAKLVDAIIDNGASIEDTRQLVNRLWPVMLQQASKPSAMLKGMSDDR